MARGASPALLLVPAVLLLLAFFVYPLAGILVTSVTEPEPGIGNFLRFFATGVYLKVFWRTVQVAFIVTALCLIVGYPMAYFLVHAGERARRLLLFAILAPFWTSVLIRSYTWVVLLGREGVVNRALQETGIASGPVQMLYTAPAVYLAMVQILLPITILTCYGVMVEIDRGLVRAARVLGASPVRAFVRIFFPLSLPGVTTGAIITFILAMGFFITPALLGGRREMMLANLIEFEVNQTTNWGFASAIALILLAATAAIVLPFQALSKAPNPYRKA